jgi:hypothetical protein
MNRLSLIEFSWNWRTLKRALLNASAVCNSSFCQTRISFIDMETFLELRSAAGGRCSQRDCAIRKHSRLRVLLWLLIQQPSDAEK